ncbi:MAG TPA: isocitrate/isopropylmalate dehydrogenase family protein [Candidatus Thermoplasmatota archaeon]|nr:isocitrate/isopropylmalate dehydrogenase family protein [Candidatus Thermoplasmatota archaeon]
MAKKVAVIGGDGIGPEVIGAGMQVLEALALPIEYLPARAGLQCKRDTGSYLPEETLRAVGAADAVYFGAITSPLASEDPNYKSVILQLRNELDAYANLRPAVDYGQPCLYPGLDLVIVRENSEGLYNAPETVDAEGVTTHRRVTRKGCDRVSEYAFQYARAKGRKEVTCAHKANVLRESDGLFRKTFYEVHKRHAAAGSPVAAKDILLDNCAMQLVKNPRGFDTIVTLNLYGDVLSDLAAGLVGGLGFAPSGNFGPTKALFEPVHGSAPDITGKGIANPVGAIMSAALMLEYLGMQRKAEEIGRAVRAALKQGMTPDVGGKLGTQAFTDLVVKALR